jgi:hypothetical protein
LHGKQKISYGCNKAKIKSRRLLVTVLRELTLEDRQRENVPANKRGWCRWYSTDLKVAKNLAPLASSASVIGHTYSSNGDLRPLLQQGSGSSGSPELLQHYDMVVVVVEKVLNRASPKHRAREEDKLARGGRCQPKGHMRGGGLSVL